MTAAVVLATYNGATYLPQQLESIARQTVRPDLVLVRDDGSTDGTVDLVRSMLSSAGLAHDVRSNAARLGAAGNFASALSDVEADVVLLCDQDDLWHPTKIEQLSRCLTEQGVVAAISNGRLIDEQGRPLGEDIWTRTGFTAAARSSWAAGGELEVLLRRSVAPGASMAFKSELITKALPMPGAGWHDKWLLLVAAGSGSIALVPDLLVDYRLHCTNTVGLTPARGLVAGVRSRREVAQAERRGLEAELQQLTALVKRIPDSQQSRTARDAARHVEHRMSLPSTRLRRARAVFEESRRGNYRRYGNGWRSVAVDLLPP